MAFKRSGVRLPLAPPASAPFGGSGSASQPSRTLLIRGKEGAEAVAPKPEGRRRTGSIGHGSEGRPMVYVYILQSLMFDHFYVGITDDLRARLRRHNAGRSAIRPNM